MPKVKHEFVNDRNGKLTQNSTARPHWVVLSFLFMYIYMLISEMNP